MTTALHTLGESMSEHRYIACIDLQDRAFRATLTPAQLREFRLWSHEIAAHCDGCGRDDVAVTGDEGPDMVGFWWSESCAACGHLLDSGSDGLEAVR